MCVLTLTFWKVKQAGGKREMMTPLISGAFINRVRNQHTISYGNGHCIKIKVKLIDYHERHCCFYLHHYHHLAVFLNSVPGAYLAYLNLGTRLCLHICGLHNIAVDATVSF